MTIFCLSHSDWEEYVPYLVSHDSKTKAEFNQDVYNAMSVAAVRVADIHGRGWIGSQDITKAAVEVLAESGYEIITPIEVTMQGSCIIRNDKDMGYELESDAKEKIFEHNRKTEKWLDEGSEIV